MYPPFNKENGHVILRDNAGLSNQAYEKKQLYQASIRQHVATANSERSEQMRATLKARMSPQPSNTYGISSPLE